jgi:UDP-N-acetylmuramoyl-L-alanyl-D-glutamate--2,6-diaminopimelate ligase
MNGVKQIAKKVLGVVPNGPRRSLLNFYHLIEAIVANIRYGFPARSMHVIIITGTNGKTTTVAYVTKILQAAGLRVGASTTAFYQIGDEFELNERNMTTDNVFKVQELIARMKKAGCQYLVLEVTSHGLEQHRVWGIPCDVAVMTNLTQDHLDYHGTMEKYAAAKAKLFKREPKFTVLNHDDEWFEYFNQFAAEQQKITYGSSEDAECRIVSAKLRRSGTDMSFLIDHQTKIETGTLLPGKFNVYNAAAAVATAYVLQVDIDHIQTGIESLEGVPGRQERVEIDKPYDVIVDYAHTPDAMTQLLESLKELTKSRLILVFGATGDRDKAKRPVMGQIAAKLADRIVLTDDEPYYEDPATVRGMVMEGIKDAGGEAKTDEVGDRREAIKKALKIARRGDIVVITGMGHEKFRVEQGKHIPWNDSEVVKELAV